MPGTVARGSRWLRGNVEERGATKSTLKVSLRLRRSLASLTAPQVKAKHDVPFFQIPQGIECAKLSVKVDQEVDGPIYNLETVLVRPAYPEISAVSLVRYF